MLEDVCVTALRGAAPYLTRPALVLGAAGLLGAEGYHASLIRTTLFDRGQSNPTLISSTGKISALRAAASGGEDDQGVATASGASNIVPADTNALVFARTFQQVLNVAYLGNPRSGGFFPNGLNGNIT